MKQEVQQRIKELNMLSPKDVVLVGVSGGADSVCLLQVLCDLRQELDITVEAIHVEHGIRGEESRLDARFVEDFCKKLQVKLYTEHVDVPAFAKESGQGLEEAARNLRYQVFVSYAKERNAKIALAHHMEDNAETILFMLARGSALTGLTGMQPVRKDENGVCFIRPLLHVHRAEIEDYLKGLGQEFCVDSTNAELEYSRNYLRNVVLPQLQNINPRVVEHINESAARLSEVKSFMEEQVDAYWPEVVSFEEENQQVDINLKALEKLHVALQREILLRAIALVAGGKKDISAVHVESVLNLCDKQSGKTIALPKGVTVKKEYQHLLIYKSKEQKDRKSESETWIDASQLDLLLKTKEQMVVPLKEGEALSVRVFSYEGNYEEIPKKTYTKWFDYDKIKQGFCVRNRYAGDFFISDECGHHKKLKQYYIDEKIPSEQRDKMWILAQENLVLWLVGGRISEHIKVSEDTKNIIEIKYEGGV